MGKALMATPAISDGMLIVRTADHVYAIAERSRISQEELDRTPKKRSVPQRLIKKFH
jgi:hypothetical protein